MHEFAWECPHCRTTGTTSTPLDTDPVMSCPHCGRFFSRTQVLRAEPIIGWRMWRITTCTLSLAEASALRRVSGDALAWRSGVAWRLGPVGRPGAWNEPTMRAICDRSFHFNAHPVGTPALNCGCGIWAMEDEEQLASVLASYAPLTGPFAYGRVQLWGRYVRHRLGWRAQFARPYDVVVINGTEDMVRDLRSFYATDVRLGELSPELAGYLSWHGRTLQGQMLALNAAFAGVAQNLVIGMQKSFEEAAAALQALALGVHQALDAALAPRKRRNRTHGRPRGRAPRARA